MRKTYRLYNGVLYKKWENGENNETSADNVPTNNVCILFLVWYYLFNDNVGPETFSKLVQNQPQTSNWVKNHLFITGADGCATYLRGNITKPVKTIFHSKIKCIFCWKLKTILGPYRFIINVIVNNTAKSLKTIAKYFTFDFGVKCDLDVFSWFTL